MVLVGLTFECPVRHLAFYHPREAAKPSLRIESFDDFGEYALSSAFVFTGEKMPPVR
jgi:hypothetical protein